MGGCPAGTNIDPNPGAGDSVITLSAPSLEAIRLALGENNPEGVVPGFTLGAIQLPPCTQQDGSALGGVEVTYSLGSLPVWLSFDPLTRTLSLNGSALIPMDALSAVLLQYVCNVSIGVPAPLSASQDFTFNDLDGGGVLDAFEYQYGWVPLNRADAYFMGVPYLSGEAMGDWFQVPTGVKVSDEVMDPADPSDDRADFDGDTLPNLNEIEDGTNVYVAASNGEFIAGVDYGVGTWPYYVTTGDFNGDGNLDLANPNWGSDTVTVLLGIGDGTFASVVSYAVGHWPFGISAGDFDGDGNVDLVTANWSTGNVSILLGIGDGTFAAAVNYPVASHLYVVETGDFNNDAVLDLAVTAAWSTDRVYILLGNGDGTFATPTAHVAGADPIGMSLGDFDGDGNLDVVVANHGGTTVSVLLGIGDGTLGSAIDYSVGSGPSSVSTGDFDQDGVLDLAVPNDGDDTLSILLGDGSGAFPTEIVYGVGDRPVGITIGDFDGDGNLDISTVNWGSDDISLFFGNGDGSFTFIMDYIVGGYPGAATTGDFDRDGSLDMAVANVGDNDLSVMMNTGECDDCLFAYCGDGTVDEGEACDDGNNADGDGCSVICEIEGDSEEILPPAAAPTFLFEGSGCQLGGGPGGGLAGWGLMLILLLAGMGAARGSSHLLQDPIHGQSQKIPQPGRNG